MMRLLILQLACSSCRITTLRVDPPASPAHVPALHITASRLTDLYRPASRALAAIIHSCTSEDTRREASTGRESHPGSHQMQLPQVESGQVKPSQVKSSQVEF